MVNKCKLVEGGIRGNEGEQSWQKEERGMGESGEG